MMDDRDNGTKPNCASFYDEKTSQTSNEQTTETTTDNDKHRHCVSLPLYYNQVRLYSLEFFAFVVFILVAGLAANYLLPPPPSFHL